MTKQRKSVDVAPQVAGASERADLDRSKELMLYDARNFVANAAMGIAFLVSDGNETERIRALGTEALGVCDAGRLETIRAELYQCLKAVTKDSAEATSSGSLVDEAAR
jgi:hypothetical protein